MRAGMFLSLMASVQNGIWRVREVLRREEGQGMVEYGLIIALVAVVLVGALTLLKDDIAAVFGNIGGAINPPE